MLQILRKRRQMRCKDRSDYPFASNGTLKTDLAGRAFHHVSGVYPKLSNFRTIGGRVRFLGRRMR